MTSNAPYGYCPTCGEAGTIRARNPKGPTVCASGHSHDHDKFKANQPKTASEVFFDLARDKNYDLNMLSSGQYANFEVEELWQMFNRGMEHASK